MIGSDHEENLPAKTVSSSEEQNFIIMEPVLLSMSRGHAYSRRAVLLALGGCTAIILSACNSGSQQPSPTQQTTSVVIHVTGASEQAFNSLTSTITYQITGASFSTKPENVHILLNAQIIPASLINVSSRAITLTPDLQDGQNHLIFTAVDNKGDSLFHEMTLWAGSATLAVIVSDQNGNPVDQIDVTARLSDDAQVIQTQTTQAGQVLFQNVPDRAIILIAHGKKDNVFGTQGVTGTAGEVSINVLSIGTPSPIDNNDFSQGTDGWDIGNAPVTLVSSQYADTSPSVYSYAIPLSDSFASSGKKNQPQQMQPFSFFTPALDHQDLVLRTQGEGPQTISRIFQIKPGTHAVKVRYRFITSEIPGGFFGSQYNDYFSVSIRSALQGSIAYESNSMNGMGLAAFDANGATAWREITLSTPNAGDTVQIDVTVANVADGLYDSEVVVDSVQEQTLNISSVALANIDNNPLEFLAIGEHPYYHRKTRIFGTIVVAGAPDDKLTELKLAIIQNGQQTASADLSAAASQVLLNQPFGGKGKVEMTDPGLLFELSVDASKTLQQDQNGTLSLAVMATSGKGQQAIYDCGKVEILVRYPLDNRHSPYGLAEENPFGGNDWVKPSVKRIAEQFATRLIYGDFSKMNGGPFPPHNNNHSTGNDIDVYFAGYSKRDATVAQKLIAYANEMITTFGSQSLSFIGVTFTTPFNNTLKDVMLVDGRSAYDVFRNWNGYENYCYFRIEDTVLQDIPTQQNTCPINQSC